MSVKYLCKVLSPTGLSYYLFFYLLKKYLFTWLAVLGLSCGTPDLVPRPGVEPGLHWEHGVLAIGPPGKSLDSLIYEI